MILNNEEKDNLYYLCCIIEYLGRLTNNKRDYIVNIVGKKNIKYIYENSQILHCEQIKDVCKQIIEECKIKNGNYNIKDYANDKPPRVFAIGKLYSKLIIKLLEDDNDDNICNRTDYIINKSIEVLNSWLILKITNFNSSLYYSVIDYLKECYLQGKILDY